MKRQIKQGKLRKFKCHICGTIILTDKKRVLCDKCNNEYVEKGGKFYRRNWASRVYGKKR